MKPIKKDDMDCENSNFDQMINSQTQLRFDELEEKDLVA